MTDEDWSARYKARLIAGSRVDEDTAQDCLDACPLDELKDSFEDDPEGAANEEMSYWELDEED